MRKMKDSGIAWIGEIPEEWERHRIKNHFSIIAGSGFKPDLQGTTTGDFPVCKASDISGAGLFLTSAANYISADTVKQEHFSIIPAKSILFPKIGEAMRKNSRAICMVDCCADNNCQALVPKQILTKFSYYLLTCIDMDWFDNKGTIPSINNQKLTSFSIPYPPLDEQRRIAAFLDEKCVHIDAVIEKTRASIDEYKKLKQAIITRAVTKGLRQGRKMKDSGIEWIGRIPEEWRLVKIKVGVTKVGSGKTPSGGAESYPAEGILFLRSQNIYDTGLVLENPTYITPKTDEEMKNTRVQPDDVLLNITGGSIGRCAIFPANIGIANVNQHVSIIRVRKNVIIPEFMHYYWLSSLGYNAIHLYQTGGNREGMSADAIKNSQIPLPSSTEQQEIAAYLDAKTAAIDRLIAKKEQLIAEMQSCKKSLIYEAVTGKREALA